MKAVSGTPVAIGIRPEHFKAGGSASLNLTADIVEHFGAEPFAYARHGTGELLTLATNNDPNLGAGDSYEAHFNPASMLIFSESGTRIR